MTPLPDEQPLSRRQLREQQRTTDVTPETKSRRVSTTTPVSGGAIPNVSGSQPEPSMTAEEVEALERAAAEGSQLTRRQARDLERVRTASVTIIPPLVEPGDARSGEKNSAASQATVVAPASKAPAENERVENDAVATEPGDSEPVDHEPVDSDPVDDDAEDHEAEARPDRKPRARKAAPAEETAGAPKSSRLPSFVPASAARAGVVDHETPGLVVVGESDDEAPAKKRTSFGLPVVDDDESDTSAPHTDDDEEPQLASNFGAAVSERPAPVLSEIDTELEEPFDQIIARGLEEAGNGVGTSSLILPSMPTGDPFTGPLTAQGGVVITGSIDISTGTGSTGKHPSGFDRSDIDSMFDEEDEARPATAGTPVSASRAVSTHTATRDVITPPAPARSNRLLLILAITAGVLAVAVLSVIIVGIAAGAFQSR
ncbi:hypothetical protein [Mycetocola zhujimingii]|uniref:Uncharacterized protein n=1 Tax=Mycetocola zhujimingii TaxID=2079792 RepID=A0A2U1TH07_9MICO|nr:hypothetical protein [Mycetocola zhujimingii]PWC08181.1 hypothetical protein DF223_02185 [Mycetocola zhujimingii]